MIGIPNYFFKHPILLALESLAIVKVVCNSEKNWFFCYASPLDHDPIEGAIVESRNNIWLYLRKELKRSNGS